MSIKIININSEIFKNDELDGLKTTDLEHDLNQKNQNFWQDPLFEHSPIFLVDKILMDFIYPPFKRKCLNEEKLKNIIDEIAEKSLKEFNFEGLKEQTIKFVAFGVYCSEHECEKNDKKPKLENKIYESYEDAIKKFKKFNCIFICPERIKESAEQICTDFHKEFNESQREKAFEICFKKVVLHEIAHGYMDQVSNSIKKSNDWYKETWGKIIEESFANLLAIKQFNKQDELQIIEKFTNEQPIEYQLYRFWMKKGKNVNFLILCWLKGEIPSFKNYYTEFGSLFSKSKILKNILDPYIGLSKSSINYKFNKNVEFNDFINDTKNIKEFFWKMIGVSILVYAEELTKNWEITGVYKPTIPNKNNFTIQTNLVKAEAEVKKNDPSSLKYPVSNEYIIRDSSGNLIDEGGDKITLKVKKM